MKFILCLASLLIFKPVFCQDKNFDFFLKQGKAEFKKDSNRNYSVAVENLEKAVSLKPASAEAHYFLGYAYSRLNSHDGTTIIQVKPSLTLKSSEEFEMVNKLEPKYLGEMVISDPYTKITVVWSELSISYWYHDKPDSSIWALNEAKKRGGFGEFLLSVNRSVLDLCPQKAILISSGANSTFYLWYLQNVEAYRKDVRVVDADLLNTIWYPRALSKQNIIQFDFSKNVLDTIEYINWHDSMVVIGYFAWIVKPTYMGKYLLRGDQLLLSILRADSFNHEVCFPVGVDNKYKLGLEKYLVNFVLMDRVKINYYKVVFTDKIFFENAELALQKLALINLNSSLERDYSENIQYYILKKMSFNLEHGRQKEAKELMVVLDKYINQESLKYLDELEVEFKKYVRDLKLN